MNIQHCQNRDEWLAARMNGVGGSDAPLIAIPSGHPQKPKWGNSLSVWAQKCGLAEPMAEPEDGPLFWGKFLEQPIKDRFCELTGRTLRGMGDFDIVWHAHSPFMFATLDDLQDEIDPASWSLDCEFPGGPGVLEVKNVGTWKGCDWEHGAPLYYEVQIQHQMACSGCKWGSFAVLIGGQQYAWLDVVRNDSFIAGLERRLESFWRLVEDREQPEPEDGEEATIKALGSIYRRDNGSAIPLPNEAVIWDEEIQEAEHRAKELKKRADALKAKIRAAIGSASEGLLPNGERWTWKANKNNVRALRRA